MAGRRRLEILVKFASVASEGWLAELQQFVAIGSRLSEDKRKTFFSYLDDYKAATGNLPSLAKAVSHFQHDEVGFRSHVWDLERAKKENDAFETFKSRACWSFACVVLAALVGLSMSPQTSNSGVIRWIYERHHGQMFALAVAWACLGFAVMKPVRSATTNLWPTAYERWRNQGYASSALVSGVAAALEVVVLSPFLALAFAWELLPAWLTKPVEAWCEGGVVACLVVLVAFIVALCMGTLPP